MNLTKALSLILVSEVLEALLFIFLIIIFGGINYELPGSVDMVSSLKYIWLAVGVLTPILIFLFMSDFLQHKLGIRR